MSFKILGTGSYAPEHVVTNDDLSALVDTNDEWITQRIGVRSRHISETETNVDMAVKAAERALENAGIAADELDLIIATTITGDTLSPGTGCMVQNRIGAHCPAFDLAAACSGFLFALETAAGFLSRGAYNRVLVVSAERMSGIIDWTDRGTCCIIGDGRGVAAAFMLGAVGVQLGTRFLVAKECGVHQNYKNKVLKANDIATMSTGKRLGHPVRSIKNPYTKEYFKLEYSNISDEELEAYGRGSLYRAAVEGDEKTGCFLAGQIAGMVNKEQTAKEIIEEIFTQAEDVLKGATKWVK